MFFEYVFDFFFSLGLEPIHNFFLRSCHHGGGCFLHFEPFLGRKFISMIYPFTPKKSLVEQRAFKFSQVKPLAFLIIVQ